MIDPSYFFSTVAQVSATFLALTFAIFAIYLSKNREDLSDSRIELKYIIKYSLVKCAFIAVVPSLFCLSIFCVVTIPNCVVISIYNCVVISIPTWTIVIILEFIVFALMFVSIWNIINRVYYSILQHEPRIKDFDISTYDENVGIWKYIDKRYNVEILKRKIFRRFERKNASCSKKISNDHYSFDECIDMKIKHLNSSDFKSLNTIINDTENKIDFIVKELEPMLQAPNQILMICIDRLTKDKWDELSVNYSLLLVHESIVYSKKQQRETLRNKIGGRSCYINHNDSLLYTMYGILMYHHMKNSNEYNFTEEIVLKTFNRAFEYDVTNNVAMLNIEILKDA